MQFIKLTSRGGTDVFVNIAQVKAIWTEEEDGETHTALSFIGERQDESPLYVAESPDQVVAWIHPQR